MNQYERNLSLFPQSHVENDVFVADSSVQVKLGQFPTPIWAAEALVERHFSHLTADDLVFEPSCGPGSFMMAIPEHVPVIGFEIDPRTAAIARINTGREVITGDFVTAQIDRQPTAIIGNPPFQLKIIDDFLKRSYELLPEGGQVGLILPAYAFQTAERVAAYSDTWSLFGECIPRNIYPGLSLPLMFAKFSKERVRTMVGFALHRETADMQTFKKQYRDALSGVGKSVWKATIAKALNALGGRANVEAICAEIEGKKPTRTKWWREQIRKVLRQATNLFKAHGNGWYTFA